jgi:hypothetical protein
VFWSTFSDEVFNKFLVIALTPKQNEKLIENKKKLTIVLMVFEEVLID